MRLSFSRTSEPLSLSPSDWLVLIIIGGIGLSALGWLATVASHTFTVEVPARGGTLTEGIVGTPRFINPVLAVSDADRDMVALTFSGLLRAAPDGTLVPDEAEAYSVSDDERTYTVTLREGATFHDGTPITADDVAFTVQMAQNPTLKSPKRANWEGVQVLVIDPRTISFTLKEPYAPFLENMRLGILPKHAWQGVSAEELPFSTLNIHPVGNGPFKVEVTSLTTSGIPTTITLTPFTGAARVPYISRMTFTFYSDHESLAQALRHDASLAAHSISPQTNTTHTVHEAILGRVFGVFFNQNQNDLFADKAVRTALDRALDKQALVSTLIGGFGTVVSGPLPPQSIATDSVAGPTAEERVAEAVTLLTKAGWTKNSDGIFVKKEKKSEKRLALKLATGNAPELKGAAEFVATAWRAVGVDVTTQFFEHNDLQQEVIRPRKYEALLFGEVVGRDSDLFAFWDSSQRNDPGLNIALYTNTTVDKILKDVRTTEDPVARRAKAEAVARIIEDEVAAIFLYSPHFIYLTPTGVSGIELGTIATPSDRFSTVHQWYLKTERVWPLIINW